MAPKTKLCQKFYRKRRRATRIADLANFVLSRNPKSLNDLIHQIWKMKDVSSSPQRIGDRHEWKASDKCEMNCDEE